MRGLGIEAVCQKRVGRAGGDVRAARGEKNYTDMWFHSSGAREEEGRGEGVDVLAMGGFGLGGVWGGGGGGEDLGG